MEIAAVLTIPGEVYMVHPDKMAEAPAGVWLVDEGTEQLGLYVGGERVGRSLCWTPQGEHLYMVGDPVPRDFIVHNTIIDCVLELPHAAA